MFFDLYKNLTTNADFRDRVEKITNQIAEIEHKPVLNKGQLMDEAVHEMLETCHWNPSLLVPYLYPRYPEDKPLSLFNRPFAMAMMHMAINGSVTIRAGRQISKALADDEPVLTPTGWVPIASLQVGDTVYGGNGRPAKVTGVFPQGVKPLFRVSFTDGASVVCCEDHLWKCRKAGRKWTVKSLKEIRARKGGDNPTSDQGVRIPLTGPVNLPAVAHHIHPYVLGVLLGDGTITPGNIKLTSADPEIVDRVRELQPDVTLKPIGRYAYNFCTGFNGPRMRPFRAELERLDVRHRAEDKCIPEEYLHDSATNRLELLRGLMDTDGSIRGKGMVMYLCTVSETMANQVVYLAQSLGGTAKIHKRNGAYRGPDGSRKTTRPYYQVFIRLWNTNPFWLPRKASKFYNIRYKANRVLDKIEPVGEGSATCITVDSPDHTFLTKDFLVTHNSTTLIVRQRAYTQLIPKFKSLYVAPHASFRDIYANRMREMDQAFRFTPKGRRYGGVELRDNLKFKELPNGARIRLVKCHTDVFEARSDTADEILYDEYQLMDIDLEPDINQCQKASKMPSIVYAGTSTKVDSPLEYRFQESAMGQWHVRRPSGKGWINFGNHEEIIPCIRPQGLICDQSGRLINVRNGEFVYEKPSRLDTGIIRPGFHVPQLIVPEWVEQKEEWTKIYRDFIDYPRHKFLEECLGIPTEEGHREITERDLRAMCCLPFTPESVLDQLQRKNPYRYIISGIDWGGSDYQREHNLKKSYTVHVIIGVKPDGTFEILFFQRHSGANYDKVIGDIVKTHLLYKGNYIVSDFGAGSAYHQTLRKIPQINPERHFIFGYTGPKSATFKVPGNAQYGDLSNHFSINKSETITMLFRAIRTMRIKCYPWEIARTYLEDYLNVYRALAELPGGETLWKFIRNPAKTDDALHATNFAFTLGRLLLGEPIIQDPALQRRMESILFGRTDGALGDIDMSQLVVSG